MDIENGHVAFDSTPCPKFWVPTYVQDPIVASGLQVLEKRLHPPPTEEWRDPPEDNEDVHISRENLELKSHQPGEAFNNGLWSRERNLAICTSLVHPINQGRLYGACSSNGDSTMVLPAYLTKAV